MKKGPQLGGEQFVRRQTEQMAEAKWQEAFKLLKKLIESTPDSDPAKPDLFYRLSEMYWERASATDILAFDQEERCLQGAAGNKALEGQCAQQRQQTLDASKTYREQAIKVYKHIVRNFPRYPRLDGVLFALAFNYQQRNEPEKAKKIYIELIRRYPQSVHVPDTLLNVGEIFFDAGQVDQALKAYEKVVTSYQDSTVYGYALYKLGWCNYNLNNYTDALKYFLKVIDHTNDLQRSGQRRNRLMLKKEAQRDLVRTYVHIEGANPIKAVGFFRKVAPDDYLDLSERLAMLYGDTGQFEKSNILLRELIKLQPRSYKVVTFQRQISLNTRNIGNQLEAVRELKRLVSLWTTVKDAKDADPERVAEDKKGIEEQLRAMATQYHRQALKTKAQKDYALAYELYDDYMKAFPDGPNAYEMTFYYAELNYNTHKWKAAARNYEKTLEINPEGEFTQDAAHGTVLAYKKLLLGGPVEGTDDQQPQMKGGGGGNVESTEVPQAKPIGEDYQRFLKAADLYRKYVKKSEYLVDIEYDAARVYYDLNHFDEAGPRFKDIAEKHRNHRLAIFAANLLLDIYNLQKKFDDLEKQADIFLGMYPEERDPEFHATLIKIKQQSTFKRCSTGEAQKKYRQAARCFINYAKRFPKSEFVDKALYNAALNYEREKLIEQSIQTKLALINNYSESELVPKALFQVAGNLHALAIYSEASKAYEFYAANFPDREEAKEALRFAALFRQGLGELDQAIKDARGYMKIIGKSDPVKAAEVFFSLGKMYEKQEKWDAVIDHFQTYIKSYGDVGKVDLKIEAYTRIGNAYMAQKRQDVNKAQRAYKQAYETFTALPDGDKAQLTTGRNAVAEARFKMGEAIFEEFSRMKLKIRAYRNVKKYVDEMTKAIGARGKLIVEARDIYLEVINFKSPNWAIAALARIGQMYQAAANDIYNLSGPGSFSEEQQEVFKGAMAEKASAPEGKAVEAYVLCIKKAQELRWFNEWSDLAERQLAKLNPREYRYNSELRAKPDNFGGMLVKPKPVTEIKDQEDEG
ncbi:MAG: tetratricopeptide repeat protein [Myxococcales bacterium]|nr:tetratricopeptide repeat protein [Myxococcales bacterium]